MAQQSPLARTAAGPGIAALLFTWGGGAVFLVSILIFLYFYEGRFGHQFSASTPGSALAIDVSLFTLFALHHSFMARSGAKRWLAARVPAWLERALFTWVASLLFLLVCFGWRSVNGTWYAVPGGWRLLAYAAQAAGLWLMFAGSASLDVLDLAGVRQVLDARHGALPRRVPLQTHGVHAIVRHPLYFGWALFVFGAPDMTWTRAVFACVSSLYLVVAIPFEERSLLDLFGDEYRCYRRMVRWRMIPGLY